MPFAVTKMQCRIGSTYTHMVTKIRTTIGNALTFIHDYNLWWLNFYHFRSTNSVYQRQSLSSLQLKDNEPSTNRLVCTRICLNTNRHSRYYKGPFFPTQQCAFEKLQRLKPKVYSTQRNAMRDHEGTRRSHYFLFFKRQRKAISDTDDRDRASITFGTYCAFVNSRVCHRGRGRQREKEREPIQDRRFVILSINTSTLCEIRITSDQTVAIRMSEWFLEWLGQYTYDVYNGLPALYNVLLSGTSKQNNRWPQILN